MEEKIITRRDFLHVAAGTTMAATLGIGSLGEGGLRKCIGVGRRGV